MVVFTGIHVLSLGFTVDSTVSSAPLRSGTIFCGSPGPDRFVWCPEVGFRRTVQSSVRTLIST